LLQEKDELLAELTETKENLELLMTDNDEKDKTIKDMERDLNIKTSQVESLMKGLKSSTEEQDEITNKIKEADMAMTAMKVEKDMTVKRLDAIRAEKELKEKEAARHLEEV